MKTIRSSLINPMLALLLVFQSCTIYQKQEIGLPEDPNPKDRYKIYTEHGKVYRGVKLLKKQDTIHGIHYRLKPNFFPFPRTKLKRHISGESDLQKWLPH
ncbi:hypothetical protein ACT6NV_06840 [Robiginitalea sp. IMCC44478]|uniref:hypothetical protein n=1 Tax=Robiginitalea sp. IMCC44478 TaxID=3459122 RepID=UPI00404166FC